VSDELVLLKHLNDRLGTEVVFCLAHHFLS
jgi:hypothetical protein